MSYISNTNEIHEIMPSFNKAPFCSPVPEVDKEIPSVTPMTLLGEEQSLHKRKFSNVEESLSKNDKKLTLSTPAHGFQVTPSTTGTGLFGLKDTSCVPILVSLEGNIGAGKSTLLKLLRESCPDFTFIDEPVDIWSSMRNEENQSLLELFYGDQRRWSYTFQNCALISRYENIEKSVNTFCQENSRSNNPQKYRIFITERCLDTDHEVFAKMLRADKKLDSLEFELYERWLKLLQKSATPLSAIVFVNTPADVCDLRIRGRGRDGEDSIPLAYLESLDSFQKAWIDSTDVPIQLASSDAANVANVEKFIRSLAPQQLDA